MAAPRRTAAPTRKRARTAPAVTSATDIEEAPSFTDSEVAQVSASSIMQTAIRAGVAVLSWQKPCWLAHHLCALRVGVGVGREVCSTNVFNINAYAHLLKNCKWCTCVLYTRGGRLLSCLVSYPTAAAVARCAARCWPGMTRTTACCPGAATRARGAARQRRASRSPRPQTCRPACLRTGSGSARRAPRCGCRSVCRRAEVLSLLNLPPCNRRSWQGARLASMGCACAVLCLASMMQTGG